MKKLIFFLFAFSALIAVAQNRSTVETRALLQNLRQSKGVAGMSKTLLERYPLRYGADGAISIGVVAKVNERFNAEEFEHHGIKVTSRIAQIVSMRVPIERLNYLEQADGIEVFSVAHRVEPTMDNTRVDTRTDSVQAGEGVPMPFNGEGVLIGITDWGFDYTHPNLNLRNNLRIIKAWDHFKLSGPAPAGFDYGTEYSTPEDVFAAKGDTSGLYGYGTHGTHVAGICGGNGVEGHCIGQAPGAKYILGSWYLDEAAWLDQVAWMYKISKDEGKRLVINSSWGMYTFSTLDGTSLLSQGINAYADSGIVFVTSGGNNGDARFHIQHTFNANDTIKSVATYYSSGIGQALIYWGAESDNGGMMPFKAGFALINRYNQEEIYYSPMYSTNDNIDFLDTFIVTDYDTVRYDIMTESANPLDGRPHVLLNVSKNNTYMLIMLCSADEGAKVHIWNVCNVRNHAGNAGCDFENGGVFGCMNGDAYYGIGEPGCAEKTLTVAAHNSDFISNGEYFTGSIAYFSSNGPTLDGRYKPEISAPGVNVVSSISRWQDAGNYATSYSAIANGHRYIWSSMSGTSMSSPAVTGIVALMLQANPNLSVNDIRDILFRTARNDDKTGPLRANDSISLTWGHGKVDALRAVNAAYDKLDIETAQVIMPELVAFPNPTTGRVTVRTGSNNAVTVELYTIDGRKVMEQSVVSEGIIDISTLQKGVYFLRTTERYGVRTAKIVKQ